VNNAGMVQQGVDFKSSRIEDITDAEWQRHLALNVTTAFNVTRAVLPLMQKQEYGRIVNVRDRPAGHQPQSQLFFDKAAMTNLTRDGHRNASRNITCRAGLKPPHRAREILAGKPLRPKARPPVAAACLLPCEEASYVMAPCWWLMAIPSSNSRAGDDWY
jgi:NAD(P)-dependent dehydrogenase (short-subunit alcohol dehydrogenase family)